jgi:hypothetical protein
LVSKPIVEVKDGASSAVILNINTIRFGDTLIVQVHAIVPTPEAAAVISAIFERIEQLQQRQAVAPNFLVG